MRCSVCDRSIENPVWNSDLHRRAEDSTGRIVALPGQWEICSTCLDVVHDALGKWKDQPFAAEDDFGEPDPLEQYANELLGEYS